MATDGVRMTEIGDQPRPVATGVSVDDGTRDRRGRSSVGFEPRSLPSIPYDFGDGVTARGDAPPGGDVGRGAPASVTTETYGSSGNSRGGATTRR